MVEDMRERNGWRSHIVERGEQVSKIAGLNWIVKRSPAWLGRHGRMSKDHEFRVQTSEALITIAACAKIIRRIAPA